MLKIKEHDWELEGTQVSRYVLSRSGTLIHGQRTLLVMVENWSYPRDFSGDITSSYKAQK